VSTVSRSFIALFAHTFNQLPMSAMRDVPSALVLDWTLFREKKPCRALLAREIEAIGIDTSRRDTVVSDHHRHVR